MQWCRKSRITKCLVMKRVRSNRFVLYKGDAPVETQTLSLSYELVEWSKSIPRIWISHIGQEVKQMEEAIWTFTVGWLVVMVAISVAYLTIYLGR